MSGRWRPRRRLKRRRAVRRANRAAGSRWFHRRCRRLSPGRIGVVSRWYVLHVRKCIRHNCQYRAAVGHPHYIAALESDRGLRQPEPICWLYLPITVQILGVTVEVHSEVRSSTLSVDVASVGPTPSSFAPSRGSSLPLSATFGVTTTRSVAGGPTEVVAEDVGKSAVGRPVGAGATAELFKVG